MTATFQSCAVPASSSEAVPLVRSVPERCRVCYTCVRECPAKAIRIAHGQAEVVPERCIGCGNCVRVCSQGAKEVRNSVPVVEALLASGRPVTALLAPSFPAEFPDCDHRVVVGKLRRMGFARVCETAFGADLVAREYRRLLETRPSERFIASTCPAVVSFVSQYHPKLVDRLMPVVSPMIAAARVVREMYPGQAVVFVGPCIAKKAEALEAGNGREVDAVLTFTELRSMLGELGITPASVTPSEFDPPQAGMGRLFALTRGLLETAGIREELVNNDVVASDGRDGFVEAINEFETGAMNARLLEVLCCHGCIMGAGMSRRNMPLFKRRALISGYVRDRIASDAGKASPEPCPVPDLARAFSARDRRLSEPVTKDVDGILADMGKLSTDDELNCGACGYPTCRDHAAAIREGLAEEEMCLPYTIEKLKKTVKQLADSNEEVVSIQNALAQSEKLASMGQLAAGVAHEVNNPLGIVLMYAHLLLEKHGKDDPVLGRDLETLVTQADRCKRIISGLLDFARQNKLLRQKTDIVRLVEDTVRAVNLPPGIEVEIKAAAEDSVADVDPDQIAQVLMNLLTNAQAAMPRGGKLTVQVTGDADAVTARISDTGIGIPPENLPRIFDPFFTTKQIGKGTGLGLAVVYGIVKMHRGKITAKSNADPAKGPTGTQFTLVLPRG